MTRSTTSSASSTATSKRRSRAADVVHAFSGVRPLYDDKAANPCAVTRDYVFDVEAPRRGAAPVDLRRQDHHLSQARRACAREAEAVLPAMGGAWTATRHARRRHPGRRFRSFLAELRRSSMPGCRAGCACLCAALRHARRCSPRSAASIGDLGRHFGGSLYEREARFLIAEEWARDAADILERRTKHGLHLSDAERDAFLSWIENGQA